MEYEPKITLTPSELEQLEQQAIDRFVDTELTTFDLTVLGVVGLFSLIGLGTVIYLVGTLL